MADQPTNIQNDPFWAPGTINLEELQGFTNKIILHPIPTSDPNDPLNWSTLRKCVNFALVSFYVLMTFVQLDIGYTAWGQYQEELGFSVSLLNGGVAVGYAGLAIGCFLFVPLVHKYGRRPLYIISTVLQLASCIWFALMNRPVDLWLASLLSGLGGATSETIVQITIADIFFVHNHAALNAFYLLFVAVGAFLGPVASGYIVDSQGWRWIWWWCVILFGVGLVFTVLFFEESKYIPVLEARALHTSGSDGISNKVPMPREITHDNISPDKADEHYLPERTQSHVQLDDTIPIKSYRQRLAFITKTEGPILHHLYQPIVLLFTFPAIAYTAITYGTTLAEFSILTSVQATYLLEPPYNFSASGVGLMNLAPFIGHLPGILLGGHLNDMSIVWLAKRNGGVYEPEMRLWLALPSAILTPGSVLMLGVGIAYGTPWPLLAVGFGLFGFNLGVTSSIALSYAMDCYQDVVGNALVGVVFTRNVLSVVVLFALTPWIEGMGLRDMHILVSAISFCILLIPVPLLIWGKKARVASAKTYKEMARKQPTHRDF
ncbi:Endonuclease/exonuclease/phosphatase [Purpureocillium lavendulum]|uniref:Endonuclease/exonuclease/phosphatase n=1 Tax=Purpureocillium lavendulum TaxID=1247861 RepID=A0AB34FG01_9HYPO|nr:Endonuclease/exonuclease/phosphatase [Purpureocillium lavendulum]